jgi:hypothetical protein
MYEFSKIKTLKCLRCKLASCKILKLAYHNFICSIEFLIVFFSFFYFIDLLK